MNIDSGTMLKSGHYSRIASIGAMRLFFYGFTARQEQFTNCQAKSGILSLLRGGERNNMIIELGEKLKALRTENHLRQDQVARLVNVEKSSISMYETGMRQPSYATLVRLANVFNVSTDYLLGRTSSSSIDLSGLTAAEAAMINQLVTSMTKKNKELEELKR